LRDWSDVVADLHILMLIFDIIGSD